jgi:hypothetical protein
VKASGAGPDDREQGWRKAIRIAFSENPSPPPADAGRGLIADVTPLPLLEEPEADVTGEHAEGEPSDKRKRARDAQTLSLFE